jgi:hypothetical protein
MSETTTRPLTDQERAYLGPHQDPFVTPLTGIAASLLLATFLFILGLGVLGFLPGDPGRGLPLVSGLTLLGAITCYVTIQRTRRRRYQADPARADLIAGTATVSHFHAAAALEIEEFEDEGMTFYVALADGRVLLLSGQYLYPLVDARTFPSSEFEIARSASGLLLSLRPTGTYLPPVGARKPRKNEFGRFGFAPDGAILPGPFDQVR